MNNSKYYYYQRNGFINSGLGAFDPVTAVMELVKSGLDIYNDYQNKDLIINETELEKIRIENQRRAEEANLEKTKLMTATIKQVATIAIPAVLGFGVIFLVFQFTKNKKREVKIL